jgi:eukaryotic-like serine/threonine-protein kinase
MGVVYRAERIKLGRIVAVKVLHEVLPNELKSRQRFEVEAMAMAKLEHPHCAAVLDVGLHEDCPYVVMDFVSGRNLKEVIAAEAPLTSVRAVELVRQTLSGLAHAHEHGIIHRDIKPANIVLSQKAGLGDHVKILDFGLARLSQDAQNLTSGIVVGTPSYMAPEQIRGTKLDGRADVYACGILLFELLTGKKPFNSAKDDPIEVCSMHLKVPVPRMSDVLRGQDFGELEDVVAKALAKNADDRYSSAVEFAAALDAVMPRRNRVATPLAGVPTVGSGPSILVSPPSSGGDNMSGPTAVRARSTQPPAEMPTATPHAGVPNARMPTPHAGSRFASQPTASRGATAPISEVQRAASPAGLSADFDLSLAIPQAAPSTQPIGEDDVVESAGVPQIEVRRPPATAMFAGAPPAGPSPMASANGASASIAEVVESQPIKPPARFTAGQIATALLVIGVAVGVVVLAIKLGSAPSANAPQDATVPVVKEDPIAPILAKAAELAGAKKGDEGIDLLTSSRKTYPKDARLPYQAGRLYFAKFWWSDGLAQFHDAIKIDPQYRTDPELIKTVLAGFNSTKRLNEDMANFLHDEIGQPAKPFLQETANDHPSPMIRARAAAELRRYR